MPQEQNFIWEMEWQGHVFKFQSPTKPTDVEVQKAYVDYISQKDVSIPSRDTIDIGHIETADARAERNAKEVGSFKADKMYQDATFWDRVGESFKLGLPHFGLLEPKLEPADEPWEFFAEATGGITGTVAGLGATQLLTGGVLTPLKAPGFISNIAKMNSLMKKARLAEKAGKTARAEKFRNQAEHIYRANPETFKEAFISKGHAAEFYGYKATGLLGKIPAYKNAVIRLSANSPKLARAANLFVSNAAAITAHGQAQLHPWEKFMTRASRMGKDVKTSLVFSVAGLPTPLGLTGKAMQYGVEPTLIFGAGMYSDLGQTNMTWEERAIHGGTFLAFHLFRKGMNRQQVKENISTAIRMIDPTLSEAKYRSIKDSKALENVMDVAEGMVTKNPKYMLWSNKKNPNHTVEFIRLEKPKTKQGKPKIIFRDLSNGKYGSSSVSTFYKKFSKNVVQPRGEREVGRALTAEEKTELEQLENNQNILNEALVSSRGGEPEKVEHRNVELELKNPFSKKVGLEEVEHWGKKIDDTTKEIDKIRLQNKKIIKDPEWKENYPILANRIEALEKKRYTYNVKLKEAYPKVHLSEEETFDPVKDKFSVGDFVKIPQIDESTNSLDYSKAGIGKYVGTMKDFGPGEVIAPDWMQREPSRYSSYFKDIPVFEVRIKKGAEKVKVAVGGEITDDVVHAIGQANLLDRPIVEYAKDSPEMQEISENPVVLETGGRFKETSWNPKSVVFNELFLPLPQSRGKIEQREQIKIEEPAEVDKPEGKIREVAINLGFNKLTDFYNIRREVRQYAEWWDKVGHPQMLSQSAEADRHIGAKDPHVRAAIRKRKQDAVQGAFQTDKWRDIFLNAQDKGLKDTIGHQELYDFFTEFSVMEPGTVSETFVARPGYQLKKIKSADGTKLFPEGVPTFPGAMRLEAEKVSKISDKLAQKREKSRQNFQRLKGADTEEWPNMNKMRKRLPLEESSYESYPEFNPKYDKPWVARVDWDVRKLDKIETHSSYLSRDGEDIRFATREEALDFIADTWINQESIEKQISNNIDHIASVRGDEYKIWKLQQRKLHTAVSKAGWSESDYRELLREFWPESKGSSKNMTFEELEMATNAFEHPNINQSYNDMLTSILPPADVMFNTKPHLRKFIVGMQKLTLPTYTVNMLQESKVAFDWARQGMQFEITRELNAGAFAQYLHEFRQTFRDSDGNKLSDAQLRDITHIVDPLWKDFYDPKMDVFPIQDIQKYHRNMSDLVLVKLLLNHGVEVRDGSTSNLQHKDFFTVYTNAGDKIVTANKWDEVRITKGVEFVDSNLNFNKPELEKYVSRIIEFEHVKRKRYSQEYLQSLRSVDPRTGKVDNGWFIEGYERFVPVWEGNKVVKIDKYKRNEIENAKGEKVKIYDKNGNSGKFESHIVDEHLTRIVTQKFHDEFVKFDFSKQLIEYWVNLDPQLAKMAITMSKKKQIAELMRHRLSAFITNSGGVYGTIHSRTAKLPPVFTFNKNGRLILIDTFKDVTGKPIKKGSVVMDVKGNKQIIDRILPVYESDYVKIMTAEAQRKSHISASYEIFGRHGANSKRILGDAATATGAIEGSVGEISMLAKETSADFAIWAHKSLQLQINSTEPATTLEKIAAGLTSFTAQAILSTPKAGVKNAILGNQANATVFGFRQLFNSWSRTLRNPGLMTAEARKRGALVAGVHEIVAGKGYSKFSPGLMRPTEIANRVLAEAIAVPALEEAINVLNGIKTPMNVGTSRQTALSLLSDVYKFRDKEIKDMKELGADRLHERPEYIDQAYVMAHGTTQGIPNIPFVPQWAGRRWAKPATLFYRIAYRISEIIWNKVFRPLATTGNPVPLMRYMTLLPISGAGIAAMHYLLLNKDVRNQFKDWAGQFYDLILRAEWLGVVSNAFDEHGDIVDSYAPAVLKPLKAVFNNAIFIMTRQKYPLHAFNDAAREIVLAYDDLMTVYENNAKPNLKKYSDSKRRQRQFQDVYFRKEGDKPDEADLLTFNSPTYRAVRLSFWGDEAEEKAKSYWSSVNSIINYDLNKDPGKDKLKHKSRKLAFKNLKGIVSRQRPIPTSWRKLDTGTKTRYDLFYSLLSPEDKAKEDAIEAIYQKKKEEFWTAVDDYSDEYSFGAYDD